VLSKAFTVQGKRNKTVKHQRAIQLSVDIIADELGCLRTE